MSSARSKFTVNQIALPHSDSSHVLVLNNISVMSIVTFRIACISAPSVYQKLKQLESENEHGSQCVAVVLLEFDRRFAAYGKEFIFYDYNNPLFLPEDVLPQSFDIVIADPPYLSEECLSKVALTVKHLTKSKILLCTGW